MIFREINSLATCFSVQPLLSRNFCKKVISIPQCGNYENSLSHFFNKNFAKAMVVLKNKLPKSWFHEIFFGEREFFIFPYSATLISVCTTQWKKNSLSPNFFQQINFDFTNFFFFLPEMIFREIKSLATWIFFSTTVAFTKFM